MLNEIKYLLPNATPEIDFMLQDDSDGNGVYIKAWNTAKLGIQPTPEQLAAVSVVANTPPRIARVTMRQARLALLGAGLLPNVNAAIAAMTGPQGEAARIEWEYSQEVQRDRGLVSTLGAQLGMTEAQLDALFATAAALP